MTSVVSSFFVAQNDGVSQPTHAVSVAARALFLREVTETALGREKTRAFYGLLEPLAAFANEKYNVSPTCSSLDPHSQEEAWEGRVRKGA